MNATQIDLIPVRALNQVSYCPRLYYLEYVDSVMPINEFVEDGLFQHRRVNDPALANRTRKEGDVLRTRSVSLSSERLGITGKLDLLEEDGDAIRPVETKRSTAPKDEDGQPSFWENDAIQLCAQALLVEESQNVTIPAGIIYYVGSKARVDVPFDDALRARTREAIALVRDLAARDVPPEPLPAELRHRCFGCSLATICLPEETLYLIHLAPAAPAASAAEPAPASPPAVPLPRVIPHNDDKAVLYVQEQGAYVGRRGEHLVVSIKGQEIERVPIVAIRQVVIMGNIQVTTQALQTLVECEVPVAFLNMYGKFIATVLGAPPKNVALRAAQYEAFADPARALALARAVVAAKIANQRTLLMRSLRSQPRGPAEGVESDSEPAAPGQRASDEPSVRDMADMLARVATAPDPGVLLGLEGQSAALYFGNFGRMLKAKAPGATFDFTTRNRRPPRDPVNALLSFAYALLAKDCFSAVCTVGFDPYQGFYHTGRHGRPSLALDLMEEFRPVIADSVALTLINNSMLTNADFLIWRDSCQLTDAGRKTFFEVYEQRKATEVTHPIFGYKMTYGRMLEVQARMLSGHVRGDIPRYVGFTTR
jgi:CRISPR-associated protein Cas1